MQRPKGPVFFAASAALLAAAIIPTLGSQTTSPPVNKFQTGQRHIYAAIADLQAYVKDNPTGKDARTASLQLKGLEALNSYASQASFVDLSSWGASWRILTVDQQADVTHITFEIKNTSDTATATFQAFDKFPLVLVDNAGQYYPSGDIGDLPAGLMTGKDQYSQPSWFLHGGQTVTVTVDFPPLQPGATGGQVLYKDNSSAAPAKFSLLNKKQLPVN